MPDGHALHPPLLMYWPGEQTTGVATHVPAVQVSPLLQVWLP
jgi:hypothetical protein